MQALPLRFQGILTVRHNTEVDVHTRPTGPEEDAQILSLLEQATAKAPRSRMGSISATYELSDGRSIYITPLENGLQLQLGFPDLRKLQMRPILTLAEGTVSPENLPLLQKISTIVRQHLKIPDTEKIDVSGVQKAVAEFFGFQA